MEEEVLFGVEDDVDGKVGRGREEEASGWMTFLPHFLSIPPCNGVVL